MMVSKQTQAPSEIPMCEAPMFFLACYRHVRGIGHIYDATALGSAHPTVFCELLRLVAPAFGRWHHAHERKWNTKEDPWPTPRRTRRRCSPTTTWRSTTRSPPKQRKST